MDLDQGEETLVPQAPINGQQGDDDFGMLVQDYLTHAQPVQDDTIIADQGQDPSDTAVDAAWHPQPQSFTVAEYDLQSFRASLDTGADSATAIRPIILSSTQDTFNTTVGQTRRRIGLKEDGKMTNQHENNYFKALKWSPDGSCLLSASNDNNIRIFAPPEAPANGLLETGTQPPLLEAGVVVREGEAIYDMCWYPGMTTQDPASCCFLSSSRDHPVHLWDAYTGELRCSYTIVDHCEVNVAPNSLCFNPDGSKIYCGLNNMIEIFDTTRPGRDSTKRPTTPTRKSKKGQKGVISCLTFNPDGSGLYAAGSYAKTIGLYDSRTDHLELLLKNRDQYGRSKNKSKASTTTTTTTSLGGITQLLFSPDGHYLYSASRQDPWLRCWDVRNTAEVLFWLQRPGPTTNQRISFDLSPDGRYLTTGDALGGVSFFDLSEPERERQARLLNGGGVPPSRTCYSFSAHEDIVSSASFNPVYPILATCSGQRKYQLQHSSFSDISSATESESEDEESRARSLTKIGPDTRETRDVVMGEEHVDNSIRTWSIPGRQVWYVDGQRWDPTLGPEMAVPDTVVEGSNCAPLDDTPSQPPLVLEEEGQSSI